MLKIRQSWDHLIFNMGSLYWQDDIFISRWPTGWITAQITRKEIYKTSSTFKAHTLDAKPNNSPTFAI